MKVDEPWRGIGDRKIAFVVRDRGRHLARARDQLFGQEEQMDDTKFWDLVSTLNWKHEGNDDKVVQPVVKALSAMPEAEIFAFPEHTHCETLRTRRAQMGTRERRFGVVGRA